MNILLFFPSKNGIDDCELRLIDNLPKGENLQICRTIIGLSRSLRQPSFESLIAVLLASNFDDLKNLVAIGDLLSGIPLILILPDRQDQTISKGHKLYPRFVSYADSDFSDVGLVLNKMISNIRHGERKRWHCKPSLCGNLILKDLQNKTINL